jgi:hypothetical protein
MAPPYHDVGQTIGVASAETLGIALRTLLIVELVRCLIHARHESGPEESFLWLPTARYRVVRLGPSKSSSSRSK